MDDGFCFFCCRVFLVDILLRMSADSSAGWVMCVVILLMMGCDSSAAGFIWLIFS